MEKTYSRVKRSRKNTKERILYVMGNCCQICGYKFCTSALELHHIDPKEKDFTFSRNTNLAWSKIRAELPKCILVCANCHREIHENYHQDLSSSFNEECAIKIDKEIIEAKNQHLHFCKKCGKVINKTAKNYCIECYSMSRQICERPSREKLKQLIRNIPFTQIATKYNVSDNTIRKWCVKENLPSRKKDIVALSDEQWQII